MIDARLIRLVKESRKYVAGNVLVQWIALLANIVFIYAVSVTLGALYEGVSGGYLAVFALMSATGAMGVRYLCTRASSRLSFLSSLTVKKVLREKIYHKLLRLGPSYHEQINTSEVVQTAVEGVDQLETWFGSYLPQFFYALLAPLTLFIVLLWIDWRAGLVLLIAVPLIPVSIVIVQRWAKKLLSKYWGQYTEMGDTFLENLQGLTTLKIYQSDERQNEVMNVQAEKFRQVTMRVLIMQLNSISVMDLVAYGGAAIGMIVALRHLHNGLPLYGCLMVILLSADFFLPMRQLGSFFHIAMNGMAAADKIFAFLELEEPQKGTVTDVQGRQMRTDGLIFSYDGERDVLKDISVQISEKGYTAVVGESGSGKSTLAEIFAGRHRNYQGSVMIGDTEVREIDEQTLFGILTYVGPNACLFKGTVRYNLLMAEPEASEEQMWKVLEETRLADFLKEQNGLDTELTEKASNLSGGQRQRLAIARALLRNSDMYIFDEAASNVDMESEAGIMEVIRRLSETKTVLLITHRLANAVHADRIYVLEQGICREQGTHASLMEDKGIYYRMYTAQTELEQYGMGGAAYEAL